MVNPNEWHLITAEYPPQQGGVSDYTYLVATELVASGDAVHVWCPPIKDDYQTASSVTVHRELGTLKAKDLRRVGNLLDQYHAPKLLLVQWVPHGYGYQSMNLPFCLWLWSRAYFNGDRVELMVHEPFLSFNHGTWKQKIVAAVHRLMTVVLLNAARHVWMSIPAWEASLRPYALGRQLPFTWLPVPSNIPVINDPAGVALIRSRYAPNGEMIIGHFGTYGKHISDLLLSTLPALMCHSINRFLLLGRGGERLRDELAHKHPELKKRIHATGSLSPTDLSRHVSACDVMLQPYPDGISSRRTSAMVGLSHGLPIVTTSGHLTEDLWDESGAVVIVPVKDIEAFVNLTQGLLIDSGERTRLGASARLLYKSHFDIEHTISALCEGRFHKTNPSVALNQV